MSLLSNVRIACGRVSEEAQFVTIDLAALARYAVALSPERLHLPEMDPAIHYLGHGPDTLAYYLTLDAINFGSGYFPDVFGDARRSGYRAIAGALNDYFVSFGPIPPERLRQVSAAECTKVFHLDPANPAAGELAGLYARALNDLGAFICDSFGGEFLALVEESRQSVERLVQIVTAMPLFNDVALLDGRSVPFYKRAQLTAVDLYIAFGGQGIGRFDDMDQVTICADNLVPHVLRLDGVLSYSDELAARIDRGELIAAGSPEEVEIRACAVHAGELVVAEVQKKGKKVNAMMIDNFLWHRGQEPFYRARPRHRSRTVFY